MGRKQESRWILEEDAAGSPKQHHRQHGGHKCIVPGSRLHRSSGTALILHFAVLAALEAIMKLNCHAWYMPVCVDVVRCDISFILKASMSFLSGSESERFFLEK